MNAPPPGTDKRSRWMDWEPTRITAPPVRNEPTKPSKPGFVGFVGSPPAEISIKRPGPRECSQVETADSPAVRPCVRVVEWKLKEPPIAIETCAVVTDPGLFASSTLRQLQTALENPKSWMGWSVPQLIDRLAQVGVKVAVEAAANL